MCINTKSSNPFMDDGFRWCRLKDGYVECAYKDKWNECPDFKAVRDFLRELK
jgi:hypothetical protein